MLIFFDQQNRRRNPPPRLLSPPPTEKRGINEQRSPKSRAQGATVTANAQNKTTKKKNGGGDSFEALAQHRRFDRLNEMLMNTNTFAIVIDTWKNSSSSNTKVSSCEPPHSNSIQGGVVQCSYGCQGVAATLHATTTSTLQALPQTTDTTLLHVLMQHRPPVTTVQLLIDRLKELEPATVHEDVCDGLGRTALHWACYYNVDVSVVKRLLAGPTRIMPALTRDNDGRYPLHYLILSAGSVSSYHKKIDSQQHHSKQNSSRQQVVASRTRPQQPLTPTPPRKRGWLPQRTFSSWLGRKNHQNHHYGGGGALQQQRRNKDAAATTGHDDDIANMAAVMAILIKAYPQAIAFCDQKEGLSPWAMARRSKLDPLLFSLLDNAARTLLAPHQALTLNLAAKHGAPTKKLDSDDDDAAEGKARGPAQSNSQRTKETSVESSEHSSTVPTYVVARGHAATGPAPSSPRRSTSQRRLNQYVYEEEQEEDEEEHDDSDVSSVSSTSSPIRPSRRSEWFADTMTRASRRQLLQHQQKEEEDEEEQQRFQEYTPQRRTLELLTNCAAMKQQSEKDSDLHRIALSASMFPDIEDRLKWDC